MKNKLYACLLSLATACSFSSCSDWFDISPKTDIEAEELFSQESGFFNALAGIYIAMTDAEAYGDALSFGMVDQMAQIYDLVPEGANIDPENLYNYNLDAQGYYTKSRLAATWKKEYNLIANANNLMTWLDKNGETVIRNPQTRDLLRGEALALRAYLHFDLLRGWGPIYKDNSTAKSIPYRTVADNSSDPCFPPTSWWRKSSPT